MNYSDNYNLLLPEQSDRVDVRDFNTNSNTIDGLIKDLSDAIVAIDAFIDAISNAESTEERQTLIARLSLLGGSIANATFTIGGGGEIDISQAAAIMDARTATAFDGNIMVKNSNTTNVKPHEITTTAIQKAIDGDYKTKTIETTALKVLSQASPAAGNVLVRTSENYVQESGVTLAELKNNLDAKCNYFTTDRANSATILKGRPCLYNPNTLGYTANTALSNLFVGIALDDQNGGVVKIATGGECKALVYKDTNLNYNATFGLTGKAWSSENNTGGFQAATSISDLGGFSTNVRKPRIVLVNTNDYTNMEDNTWALLDVIICMV